MAFDYFIVLAFGLAGALTAVLAGRSAARRAARAAVTAADAPRADSSRLLGWAVVGTLFVGALALLFPWAVALRELLREEGVGQARHQGTLAAAGGVLFLALLGLGAAHAWSALELGDVADPPPGDGGLDRSD